MADELEIKRINELPDSSVINNDDQLLTVQDTGAELYTRLSSVAQVGSHILNNMTVDSLTTEHKKVIEAINEVAEGSTTLAGLTDVAIATPTAGQVLKYDAETQKWENAAESGGASSLSGLTDVSLTLPANGQALVFDSTTSKWINAVISGGSSVTLGTTDPSSSQGSNGDLYVKYDDTDYSVLDMYVKINDDWREMPTGGSSDFGYTDLTATLTAGNTSLTFQDSAITTTSVIDYYSDPFGISPTNATAIAGEATLTFDAQSQDYEITLRVWSSPSAAEGSLF